MGELDEAGVEGGDIALRKVFEKTAERDEVIGLGDGGESATFGVGDTVEAKAIFADEFAREVARFEVVVFAGDFSS